MRIHTVTSLVALMAVAGTSFAATAQDGPSEDKVVSVYERYRPDFSAPGARSGSFLFFPTIDASAAYDSNIFAQRGPGEIDDLVFNLKPGFSLSSDWNNHALTFFANADVSWYVDNDRENFEDFNVGLTGRYDISRGTSFNYHASFADDHEDRGAPDDPGAPAQQTDFTRAIAGVGFVRDAALVSLAIDGQIERLEYDDTLQFDRTGGISADVINNDDRTRDRISGNVRLGYEIDENYEAFIRFSANRVEYDNSKADGGPQRNSDGYEIVAGAAFDITGKTQGEVFGGYVAQNYDSDTLAEDGDISDFTFGASLLWNPTGLTSIRGTASRTVTETIVGETVNGVIEPAASILGSLFDLQIEHELQRNVLLKGSATYTLQEFQGTAREDDLINASLGARYLFNRNLSLDASYQFSYRDTSERGLDFKRHIFMVGLVATW